MSKEKTNVQTSDDKRQLEKDQIQKAVAADQVKPRCRICGKYTDYKTSPQCFGHGGGNGGGNGGEDSDEKSSKDDAIILAKIVSQADRGNQVEAIGEISRTIALKPQIKLNDKKFNSEIISEVLSKKLLVIANDREKGILTFKLFCDVNLLSVEKKNELKKFVNAIQNALNAVKKEKGLSADCCTIEKDKDGNILSLRITLPTPTLYDIFIQRLASEHLLPMQSIVQQKNGKVIYPEGTNHFNPTPLATKPTPTNKKSIDDEEVHKTDKSQEKKSSIPPKSPLDGLKPKGL